MAQDESPIPTSGDAKRRTADLLPRYFRTTANKKFLSSTIDQLTQPGSIEKIDGYIGRRDAKAFKSTDNYVSDVSAEREDYQLEPIATVTDNLGNTTYYGDYRDYINSSKIRNTDNIDHSLYSSQEYYAWDPHINWDKFVNFREYYWLPSGPNEVPVYGTARNIISTFAVARQDNVDNNSYIFSKENKVSNPTLTLYRGQTYNFDIDAIDMPLSIRTSNSINDDTNLYNIGVSQQKVEQGSITWTVDLESPDALYYTNGNDPEASGLIIIKDIRDNTQLNVGEEIIGKKTYTMQNGYELTNGMKVKFYGTITPSKYGEGNWYVEGVGESIRLIRFQDLSPPTLSTTSLEVLFDDGGFDTEPFDDAATYPESKDYITINRASQDSNPWSRYNRWFHRSVLEQAHSLNNSEFDSMETARAKRPIIEFTSNLQLFNHGSLAKTPVDFVDTFTTDVFSTIEGSIGYNIDGEELFNGARLLVTADTDTLANNRIYTVNFIIHNNRRQINNLMASPPRHRAFPAKVLVDVVLSLLCCACGS